jgi:single-stranded-DNA-specific exonuclease
MNAYAHRQIRDEDIKKKIYIDTLVSFHDIDAHFLDTLTLLSPWGVGNPKPVFLTENVVIASEPQRIKDKHSKMLVGQNGRIFELLSWGRPELSDVFHKGDRIDLVFTLQFTEFLGEERLNLSLEDIRSHIP